jgi:hypothetical protein
MRGANEVGSTDLLLGIEFSHPRGEVRQFLDHFRIPGRMVAEVLVQQGDPPPYPFAPTTAFPPVPPERRDRLPFGRDVGRIVERATSLAGETNPSENLVRISELFGALLLEPDTRANYALRALLEMRGYFEPLALLAQQYEGFLRKQLGQPGADQTESIQSSTQQSRSEESTLPSSGAQSYAEFLAVTSPYAPTPPALPRYDADAVAAGSAGGEREGDQPDLIGITPEVDAFAHLLAAKDLQPPLAIGLFGNWGAGKTYFMRALQRRIYRITEAARSARPPRAQRDLPIFKSVAQIEFNAWHYVEGNLWASLVEHIFRNLQTRENDTQAGLDERRRALAAQVRSTEDARQRLLEEVARLESRRSEILREAERLGQKRTDVVRRAGSVGPVTREILEQAASEPSVKNALRDLGLEAGWSTVAELRAALDDARSIAHQGLGIVHQLRARRPAALAIGALVVVGIPLLSWVLLTANVPAITTAIATLTAAVTGVTALVQRGTAWARGRLRDLEALAAALEKAERTDSAEHGDVLRDLATIDAQLSDRREQASELERRSADLRTSILDLTPGQMLTRFIDERAGSDDYRKHLGVPAIIRRDFDELSRGIAELNRKVIDAADGTEASGPDAINRIILYIDDLDRCPPSVVVNVLQAVHLLLAFPLFVVVVAVDSRWLANSLQSHYQHLLATRTSPGLTPMDDEVNRSAGSDRHAFVEGQATPDDYLEKIFQIPFWIRPLDETARRQIVEGLLAPSLLVQSGSHGLERSEAAEPQRGLDQRTRRELASRLFGRDGGDELLDPAALGISRHELEFMSLLTPILGDSPRAVKRFVNVYRLMKALEEPRRAGFADDRPGSDYQPVMLLLAVITGLPAVSAEFWTGIHHPTTGLEQLGALARRILASAAPGKEMEQSQALVTWLEGKALGIHWDTMPVNSLAAWQPSIGRFSFGSETANEPLLDVDARSAEPTASVSAAVPAHARSGRGRPKASRRAASSQ